MTSLLELVFGGECRHWAQALILAIGKAKVDKDCCEIPESPCPPRCIGSIVWAFGRGALPTAAVVVRNVGTASRPFEFRATPLAGSRVGAAVISVSPASATLAPGESVVVALRLENSADLAPAQEYRAELRFSGSWEQCVSIHCKVAADESVSCAIEQGDVPPGKASIEASWKEPKPPPAIHWKIARGVTPHAQIALTNTGTAPRDFQLSTTPLVGLDPGAAELFLSTTSVSLAPREHAVIDLQLKNSAALGQRQEYHAALSIRGFTEDRIPICCAVASDPSAHVEVAQGDPPTRLRAHHWYDHFQCTVPCAPRPPSPDRP